MFTFSTQFMKVIHCGKFVILNSASLYDRNLSKCIIFQTHKHSFELLSSKFFQSKNVCKKREHKKVKFYLKILQLYRNNEDDF